MFRLFGLDTVHQDSLLCRPWVCWNWN